MCSRAANSRLHRCRYSSLLPRAPPSFDARSFATAHARVLDALLRVHGGRQAPTRAQQAVDARILAVRLGPSLRCPCPEYFVVLLSSHGPRCLARAFTRVGAVVRQALAWRGEQLVGRVARRVVEPARAVFPLDREVHYIACSESRRGSARVPAQDVRESGRKMFASPGARCSRVPAQDVHESRRQMWDGR